MNRPIELETARFLLRELTVDDVTERYHGWLSEPEAMKWIAAASSAPTLTSLKAYVSERSDRDDVLFLGIFGRADGVHIGNIKFEPIDVEAGSTIVGVLIGDITYRGQAVFVEVLTACAEWLKQCCNISRVYLGVDAENNAALKAYQKAGFTVDSQTLHEDGARTFKMVLHV